MLPLPFLAPAVFGLPILDVRSARLHYWRQLLQRFQPRIYQQQDDETEISKRKQVICVRINMTRT